MMDSGCYQLKIKVRAAISLRVGALGNFILPPGRYIYTGSAMKNLEKRIARHRRPEKKLRWHIDYLLAEPAAQILQVISYPSKIKEECQYNQELLGQGAGVPIPGFGSSDCRQCAAHLLKTV
jgi:Uri superfamily endonuclease